MMTGEWYRESLFDGRATYFESPEERRATVDIVHQSGTLGHVSYTSIMTVATTAGRIKDSGPSAATDPQH
jgi:hypothetical protein